MIATAVAHKAIEAAAGSTHTGAAFISSAEWNFSTAQAPRLG